METGFGHIPNREVKWVHHQIYREGVPRKICFTERGKVVDSDIKVEPNCRIDVRSNRLY